jgi:GTP-binding protein
MFIDQATIFIRSGKGGDGCVSFRREKFIPKGGPDGGDGGKGGDVILIADESIDTLLHFKNHPHWRAKNGGNGMGANCSGGGGEDCIVRVPIGTMVYDFDSGVFITDLSEKDQRVVVAKGGKGGLGNTHFKTSTHQTPRESTPGEPPIELTLRLELKLIADVGLVGKPNAGKSTLLRAISRATPKVADYPFTTISPHLGIAELPGDRRLVVADIPGLIAGAAQGAGLGHDFLRHIERTAVLVHLLDVAPIDDTDPIENYQEVRRELEEYSLELAEKPEVIVFNKIDLVAEDERAGLIKKLRAKLKLPVGEMPVVTSGATGKGVGEMLEACWAARGKKREATAWVNEPG